MIMKKCRRLIINTLCSLTMFFHCSSVKCFWVSRDSFDQTSISLPSWLCAAVCWAVISLTMVLFCWCRANLTNGYLLLSDSPSRLTNSPEILCIHFKVCFLFLFLLLFIAFTPALCSSSTPISLGCQTLELQWLWCWALSTSGVCALLGKVVWGICPTAASSCEKSWRDLLRH